MTQRTGLEDAAYALRKAAFDFANWRWTSDDPDGRKVHAKLKRAACRYAAAKSGGRP